MIVPLDRSDLVWLKRVWADCKHILGPTTVLHWAVDSKASNEFLVGIREAAFAHYRVRRRDGVTVLYEIGVSASERRKGHGCALIAHMSRPIVLKTDADNPESNAFYKALGFRFLGEKWGKTKLFHEYVLEASL